MVTIRSADLTDREAIAKLWNYYIRETAVTFNSIEKTSETVREAILECRKDKRAFLVAENRGRLVGFCTYFQFRGGIGYEKTMEHTILAHPDVQGRGIGRGLMQRLFNHAQAEEVKSLWAGVSGDNPGGVAFHESIGFSKIARLPQVGHKFDRWIDLILLQKIF